MPAKEEKRCAPDCWPVAGFKFDPQEETMKKLIAVLGVFFLTACASVQDAYQGYKDDQELAYVNEAKVSCTRYGYALGTDAFAHCVNTNANAAKDRDALVKAAFHGEKK